MTLFLRRERPDWLILNGDFQDFWEISNYDLTPRSGKEFQEEVEIGKRILSSSTRAGARPVRDRNAEVVTGEPVGREAW